MLNYELIENLTAGSKECRTTIKIVVGMGVTKSGKPTSLFASFRLSRRASSLADVIGVLKAMGHTPVNLTIPKITDGKIVINMRPVYSGLALANILAEHVAPKPAPAPKDTPEAKPERKPRARKAAAKGDTHTVLPVPGR